MTPMKVKGQTVQAGERFKRTDGQTDGRYQVHYLPRFAVDNQGDNVDNTAVIVIPYSMEVPNVFPTFH